MENCPDTRGLRLKATDKSEQRDVCMENCPDTRGLRHDVLFDCLLFCIGYGELPRHEGITTIKSVLCPLFQQCMENCPDTRGLRLLDSGAAFLRVFRMENCPDTRGLRHYARRCKQHRHIVWRIAPTRGDYDTVDPFTNAWLILVWRIAPTRGDYDESGGAYSSGMSMGMENCVDPQNV